MHDICAGLWCEYRNNTRFAKRKMEQAVDPAAPWCRNKIVPRRSALCEEFRELPTSLSTPTSDFAEDFDRTAYSESVLREQVNECCHG